MFTRNILAAAAFVAATFAQDNSLTITDPTPNLWWVAGSTNTLSWTCNSSPYNSYTVVLSNSNSSILTSDLSLIADVPNYDCSLTVNQQQSSLAVSDSWTLMLTSITNISDVYASTQFSVKAANSPYPATSASGTSTGASPSSTSSSKTGAASANYIPIGISMAAALVLGLAVA